MDVVARSLFALAVAPACPFVAMGGKCSPKHCSLDFGTYDPNDENTIADHAPVSSNEPYYCSPSRWRTQTMGTVDVVSCASPFYGSKGYYVPGKTSVYPPRADLTITGINDSPDTAKFARDHDVAAISAATPVNGCVSEAARRAGEVFIAHVATNSAN